MTTNTATKTTFRKTKNGKWVAFGPASIVQPGVVTVSLKNGGSKQVIIREVGKTFKVDGVDMVYGYIVEDRPQRRRNDGWGENCCWGPCPVTGIKCTPSTPCHDCI